jgi:hypothetical protein
MKHPQFRLLAPAAVEQDVGLGVWEVGDDPSTAARLAEGEPHTMPEVAAWSIALPDHLSDAETGIRAAVARSREIERVLNGAPGRLDRFLRQAASRSASPADVDSCARWQRPEQELLLLAGQLKRGIPPVDTRTFGLPSWSEICRRFQAFVRQVERFVLHFAYVETERRGELIARTVVSWTGDFRNTLWRTDHNLTSLHVRSVALAMQTRWSWLRIIQLAAEGAAKISAALSIPFGTLAAVPLAWWYLQRILDELPMSESTVLV